MKYILMHRELPVAVLSINDTSGTVYRVEDVVQPAHLPIGLFSADRREFAKNLNLWLAGVPFRPAVQAFTMRWRPCRSRKNYNYPPVP